MKSALAEHNAPTADSSPNKPGKLNKVLSALFKTNTGGLTKVITATAQGFNGPGKIPFDGLLLAGIKAVKQASNTLLPAHAFKTDDKLAAQLLENKLDISLGSSKEHSDWLTQFTYKNTEQDQCIRKKAKKEQTTNKDDFDELWSSLLRNFSDLTPVVNRLRFFEIP